MKPPIRCKLVYKKSHHLQQLYAGFVRLHSMGVIDLVVDAQSKERELSRQPILPVTVNDKFNVIYDALDGFNWIAGTIDENLAFFQKTFDVDYYFKRSFHRRLLDAVSKRCRVLPLGLNYHVKPDRALVRASLRENVETILRANDFTSRILRLKNEEMALASEDYEHFPLAGNEIRILFLTRIWDPSSFSDDRVKKHIEALNDLRTSVIQTCQREFGDRFCGGLTEDEFARSYAKSLLAPLSLTNKKAYLELVKTHAICIATTGLHGSIGWKFSEYVAASRAILTEPLLYQVPGDFKSGQNYLEFTNADELTAGISTLLQNRPALIDMMKQNHLYYNNWVRPENLVFNTLLMVLEQV